MKRGNGGVRKILLKLNLYFIKYNLDLLKYNLYFIKYKFDFIGVCGGVLDSKKVWERTEWWMEWGDGNGRVRIWCVFLYISYIFHTFVADDVEGWILTIRK